MNNTTLQTQNSQPTATEMLVYANLQNAAEALYGLLDKASVGWATLKPHAF
ncbi:MAG: hypothetical protein IJV35_03320 [Neisseriaceae bacterium]|nr:hypothetical protein [Neisseriaceae bacterium]